MKLSAPKNVVFIISLILGILGVLSTMVTIPIISESNNAFWVVVIAWVLLVLGTYFKGF